MKNLLKFIFLFIKCFFLFFGVLLFYWPKNDDEGKKLKKIYIKNFFAYFQLVICFVVLSFSSLISKGILNVLPLKSIDEKDDLLTIVKSFEKIISLIISVCIPLIITLIIGWHMQKIIDNSRNSFTISQSTTDKAKLIVSINDGLEKLNGVYAVIKNRKKKRGLRCMN